MKFRFTIFLSLLLMIALILSGCNISGSRQELSAEDKAKTIVAETTAPLFAAETIVAQTMAAASQGEDPTEPVDDDTPLAPTETSTEAPTPTITLTPTLSVPIVRVSVDTNCRTGPGIVYDRVSVLLVGQQAEVIARRADGEYWIIRNPAGSGHCWLWGNYATVEGPIANLPVWDPPPTPTPTFTPAPTTYNTGSISITQTWSADLDEGVLASGAERDFMFRAVSAVEKYLSPQNGASLAIWGTSAPGMYDCIGAALSTNQIPLASVPVGTYVCYQTNEGRPGVFRVNSLTAASPQVLTIGFTTWNAP